MTAKRRFAFEKATREHIKGRLALIGPSGTGKTWTALSIAEGLAGERGRIAVIDTENRSARKYSDRFSFDVLEIDHFAPATYIEAIEAAEAEGFDVLVIDSLSHAWIGKGGALDQVDEATKKSKAGNAFAAWRHVTPQHNALVEALVRCKCHLIVTMRSKTEYVIEQSERGKSVPKKVGMAPIQREGLDYEFDVVGELDYEHNLIITKSRCTDLSGAVIPRPDAGLGRKFGGWLNEGEPPVDIRVLGAELAARLVAAGMEKDAAKKALWDRSREIALLHGAQERTPHHLRMAAADLITAQQIIHEVDGSAAADGGGELTTPLVSGVD